MHSPDVTSDRVRRTAERYYGIDGVLGVIDRLGDGGNATVSIANDSRLDSSGREGCGYRMDRGLRRRWRASSTD